MRESSKVVQRGVAPVDREMRLDFTIVDQDGVVDNSWIEHDDTDTEYASVESMARHAILLGRVAGMAYDERNRLVHSIKEHMEAHGATEMVFTGGMAELKNGTPKFDYDKLDEVQKHITVSELIDHGALIPEHEETVPRKYNMTKLKRFGRRGAVVQDILDEARTEGPKKLNLTRTQG